MKIDRGIYRVESFILWRMSSKCFQRQRNIYRDKPRPIWQRWAVYGTGAVVLVFIAWWMLRDATPVLFVNPSSEDFNAPPGETAMRVQLDDVYWRVAIRHVGDKLAQVCQTNDYAVLTHKNIVMGGLRMPESYIYLCKPVGDIVSVLNARRVISGSASETVWCVETYGNMTKRVSRQYPFSLKYICGQTFTARTRVVRDPVEACTWLHAIDIVESVWN